MNENKNNKEDKNNMESKNNTENNTENNTNNSTQNNEEANTIKKESGFFRKAYNSITKIEKYPDMAAQGTGKAFSYLCKIVAILAIVLCLGMMYQTHSLIQEGVTYLQNEFPNFSYKDGVLDVDSQDKIVIEEQDSKVGRAIIDTKVDSEETINTYINEITEAGSGLIILKDKAILKNEAVVGVVEYNYKETLESMQITEFTKEDVINIANSTQILTLYASIFITIFIYSFIMYLLTTLSNVIMLSAFGYLATWIAKIRMRFVAIFNMSIYALTLSILLNMVYVAINIFVNFNIQYFQVMYIAVAAIYLVAAIFIIKSDFIKKQQELTKIAEAQVIVKKELKEKEEEDRKEEEKRQKEKEERKEKDKKQEDKKDAPEGSNA